MARVRSGRIGSAATMLRLCDERLYDERGVFAAVTRTSAAGSSGSAVPWRLKGSCSGRCCGSDAGEPVLRARGARGWLEAMAATRCPHLSRSGPETNERIAKRYARGTRANEARAESLVLTVSASKGTENKECV